MSTTWKRILAYVLAVGMLLGLVPTSALAEEQSGQAESDVEVLEDTSADSEDEPEGFEEEEEPTEIQFEAPDDSEVLAAERAILQAAEQAVSAEQVQAEIDYLVSRDEDEIGPIEIITVPGTESEPEAGEEADEPAEAEADMEKAEDPAQEAEGETDGPSIQPMDKGLGTASEVYIDPMDGSDVNDGLSETTPVQSMGRALSVVMDGGKIVVMNQITVIDTGTATVWENLTFERYIDPFGNGYDGFMVFIASNAELELDKVTMDGKGVEATQAMLYASVGSTVTIRNGSVLENNINKGSEYGGGLGGAIYATGATVTVTGNKTEIRNNEVHWSRGAVSGYGGGIYITNGTLVVEDGASVSGNTATGENVVSYAVRGGGIAAVSSTVHIENGHVDNNLAEAVSVDNDAANMTGTHYVAGGGGIYSQGSTEITITGTSTNPSTVDGNTAQSPTRSYTISGTTGYTSAFGGGMHIAYAEGTSLIIDGYTSISGNKAFTYAGDGITAESGGGGGIFTDAVYTSISGNAEIENNETGIFGGGISVGSTFGGIKRTLTIADNASISSNSSLNLGGGMYIGADMHVSITGGAKVINNVIDPNTTAAGYGGGVHITGATSSLTVSGSAEIRGNEIDIANAAYGGGVYSSGGVVTVSDAEIYSNEVTATSTNAYGGGLCVQSASLYVNGSAEIYDNSVDSASSSASGGGVYADASTVDSNVVEISDNVEIRDNVVYTIAGNDYSGGGIYTSTIPVTISGQVMISGNNANYGGGIYSSSALYIDDDVEISQNTAFGYGGGLYLFGSFTIQGRTVIANNEAQNGGGAYVNGSGSKKTFGGEVDIYDNSAVEDSFNTDTGFGGGILFYSVYAELALDIIENVKIHDNDAKYGAGLATWLVGDVGHDVTLGGNASIYNNNASENGGGAYIGHHASTSTHYTYTAGFTVTDQASMVGNRAASGGGAVYLDLENSHLYLSGRAMLANNTANYGGAIYVKDSYPEAPSVTAKDAADDGTIQLVHNTATGDGGAIYVISPYLANIKLTDVTFAFNKAADGYDWDMSMVTPGTSYANHAAIHSSNIDRTTYTYPYKNAYNNYDIYYSYTGNKLDGAGGVYKEVTDIKDENGASVGINAQVGKDYTITYTIYFEVPGDPADQYDVTLTDELPDGVDLVTGSVSGDGILSFGAPSGKTLTWSGNSVSGGTSGYVELAVKVNSDASITIINSAELTATPLPSGTAENIPSNETYTPVKSEQVKKVRSDSIDTNTPVELGTTIIYEIEFYNGLDYDADVIITDVLDSGLNLVSASYSGTTLYASNASVTGTDSSGCAFVIRRNTTTRTVTWTIEDVPSGSGGTATLEVTVNGNAAEEITNQATVNVDGFEQKTGEVNHKVKGGGGTTNTADPEKIVDADSAAGRNGRSVRVGDEITYAISFTNYEAGANVVVTDILETGLDFVSASYGTVECTGTTPATGTDITIAYDGTNTVTWSLDNLAAGDYTVYLKAKVNDQAGSKVENTASVVIGNNAAEDSNPATNDVKNAEQVKTSDAGGVVAPGQEVTYTVTFTANPESDGGETGVPSTVDVIITDTLDANLEFISAAYDGVTLDAATSGPVSGTGANGAQVVIYEDSGVVTWEIVGYNPSASANMPDEVTLVAKVKDSADPASVSTINNTAQVKVDGKSYPTNEVVDALTFRPNKEVVSGSPGYGGGDVLPGDKITYAIEYTNNTSGQTDVVITDKLDPNVTLVAAGIANEMIEVSGGVFPGGIFSDGSTVAFSADTITWTMVNVPANGGGGTVYLTVQVNDSVAAGTKIKNQAEVAVGSDPGIESKETENEVAKDPKPEKKLDKVDGQSPGSSVRVGEVLTYEITYKNESNTDQLVTLVDTLPTGVTYGPGGSTPPATYDATNRTLTWDLNTVAAGTSRTVSYDVTVTGSAGGTLKNTVYALVGDNETKFYGDPVETNVDPKPEKTLTEIDGTAATAGYKVIPGEELTYKVSYTNNSNASQNVTIVDKLPTGVDYVENSATDDGVYSELGHTITWVFTGVGQGNTGSASYTTVVNDTAVTQIKNELYAQISGNSTMFYGDPVETDVDNYYTIDYHMNDDSGDLYAHEVVRAGDKANEPDTAPTRPGHRFGGWYEDADCTIPYDFDNPPTGDLDLYAKWTKIPGSSTDGGSGGGSDTEPDEDEYTVTYNKNDGSDDIYSEETVSEGGTATKPRDPEWDDDYVFDGWYLDPECTIPYDFDTPVEGDLELYARWVPVEEEEDPDLIIDFTKWPHWAYLVGYQDGTVRPEANISRAEVATIFFRLITDEYREEIWSQTNPYSDVSASSWYNNAVSTVSNGGMFEGYPDGTFMGGENITRAEFATVVSRFVSNTYDGPDLFDDISGHWAADAINLAASLGWVEGYGDGTFLPDENITRAEVAALVNRVLERQPEGGDDLLEGMLTWPDNGDTSRWYYLDIQEATNSHDYEMKENGLHEYWIELLENPDWTVLEKVNSRPEDIYDTYEFNR